MTNEEINKKLEDFGLDNWYHNFEVIKGSGIYTQPNKVATNFGSKFSKKGIPETFWKNKRVLDIGSFSGALSYALEDLGANVVSVDVQDPDKNGFNLIHEIRNSTVEFRRISVYDLDPNDIGYFDVIAFTGLFYHLKHPLLAFDRINSVCNSDGYLITIGTSSDAWFHNDESEECDDGFSLINTISKDGKSINEFPICGFSANQYYTDTSNWFIPNMECIKGWHKASGFKVVDEKLRVRDINLVSLDSSPTLPRSIVEIVAKKISKPIPEYVDNDYFRNSADGTTQMKEYSLPTSFSLKVLQEENLRLKQELNSLKNGKELS